MSVNTFALAAQEYSQLGLIPLPLAPNNKVAVTPNWPTLRPRTLLRKSTHRQHRHPPGQATYGTFLFALDIDPRHDGNLDRTDSKVDNSQSPPMPHRWRRGPLPADRTSTGPDPYRISARDRSVGPGVTARGRALHVEGRPYLWLRGPQWGVAAAPAWLLEELRRGGPPGPQAAPARPSRPGTGRRGHRPQGKPRRGHAGPASGPPSWPRPWAGSRSSRRAPATTR